MLHFGRRRYTAIERAQAAGAVERDGPQLRAPTDVLRAVLAHKAGQRMNGGQALIARHDRTATRGLQLGRVMLPA